MKARSIDLILVVIQGEGRAEDLQPVTPIQVPVISQNGIEVSDKEEETPQAEKATETASVRTEGFRGEGRSNETRKVTREVFVAIPQNSIHRKLKTSVSVDRISLTISEDTESSGENFTEKDQQKQRRSERARVPCLRYSVPEWSYYGHIMWTK